MKKKAPTSRQASELRHGSASGRGTEAATWPRSPRVSTSQSASSANVSVEKTTSGSRQSPSARVERDGGRGGDRRADVDPGRVDRPSRSTGRSAKRSFTATGSSAFPSPIPIPTGTVSRISRTTPGESARASPKTRDQRERRRERASRAEPPREMRGRRREQPHAEHGDRPEQPRDRMRDVEVVLDRRQQRADPDELRAERQRREEQRGEERAPPQSTTVS